MNQLKNIPAFKFVVLFIAGILIGSKYEIEIAYLVLVNILLITLSVFLIYKYKLEIFKLIILSCLVISFGVLKANLDFFTLDRNNISRIPNTERKSNYELIGIISELPDYDSSRIRFVLESKKIVTKYDSVEVSGDVMVTIRMDRFSKLYSQPPRLNVGDEVSMLGKLSDAFNSRNPGEFDYRNYLRLHDIYKTFFVFGYDNVEVLSKDNLGFFYQKVVYPAKVYALGNIDKHIAGDKGAYLKGLVTGERSDLSKELKESFINTGVMHLIAVSGLNVAYIIISITLILSLFRIPQLPRTIITILVLIFYCIFTDSPASIVRATIMGILFLISIILERKTNFYNVVGVSALFILIYDSKQFFDPGFVLSFGAVISMVFFYERFEKLFVNKISEWEVKGKRSIRYLLVMFLTTLAAQIGTLPITAMYFEKISFISLLANMIVVPLANIALAIGFFQIIAGVFSGFLSSIIAETNNILLGFQLMFIKWCASFDFAYTDFYKFNLYNTITYFVVLVSLFTATMKKLKFRLVISFLIIVSVIIYNIDFDKKLKVTFLDVGQGDCAIIHTPDNKTILVDCGKKSMSYNSGERTIAPYLKRNGITKIDLLILTHYHLDHVGGAKYLLENFEVDKIIDNGQKSDSKTAKVIDNIIREKKISRVKVKSGDYIDGIEDLRIYFFKTSSRNNNSSSKFSIGEPNNGSLVFKLKYKETDILFTGDVEEEGERCLQRKYSEFLESDILKVAHHGSNSSSSIPFLVKNKPDYSVISVGQFNKFDHPSKVVLNRLENICSNILRTDLSGAIILESDGFNVDVLDWR